MTDKAAPTDRATPDKGIPPMPSMPPRSAEALAVAALWLTTERDVPLRGSNGGMRIIKAGPGRSATEIQIQFEPWQRHHRVREIEDGKVVSEFCVPEDAAIYVVVDPTARPR